MGYPVGTKLRKKQPATVQALSFEQALMALEDVCLDIKDGQFTHGKEDIDRLYWQQKLKNIAMPISLALSEFKGPRVFHHHYKHTEGSAEEMIPVLESARENLMMVVEKSLYECENLNGMKGSKLLEEKEQLCRALRQMITAS
jgi:hypothetical protein